MDHLESRKRGGREGATRRLGIAVAERLLEVFEMESDEVMKSGSLDGAVFMDGHLFFLTDSIKEWAKEEAVRYRESFPCAEFRPEIVRVYGWCGPAEDTNVGRPVLIVEGREIGRQWVEVEGIGGLFGEPQRVQKTMDLGHCWVLLGHRTELPGWVFNELMGEARRMVA
jgi:hypothetical protein